MLSDLHPSATTTRAIRRSIQDSRASINELAARYGIDRKTVMKWRHRRTIDDAPRGRAQEQRSTVLTIEDEAIVVGWRTTTLLPLDDCLYSLRTWIPHLTRSSLHRCLQRYGLNRLPPVARYVRATPDAIGVFRFDIGRTKTGQGDCHVFVATDLASRLFFAKTYRRIHQSVADDFLKRLIAAVPYRIHTALTVCDAPFVGRAGKTGKGGRLSLFASTCSQNDIRHEPMSPDHTWAQLQRLRVSPWKGRYSYDTPEQLEELLHGFMQAYNFGKRLKILNGLTPHQFVRHAYAKLPSLFPRSPL